MKALFFIIFLMPISMFAQKLSVAQALVFAEKLHEVRILSETGRDSLVSHIQKGTIAPRGIRILGYENGKLKSEPAYDEELFTSTILQFCVEVFGSAYYFRTGLTDEGFALQKEVFKDVDTEKIPPEDYQKLIDTFHLRSQTLEGVQIEKKIVLEDILPDNFSITLYPMGFPSGRNFANGLHETRSATGKTRTRTLNDLLKIGLINHRIYDETLPKIQSNELPFENFMLDFLCKRTIFYEDFEENKKQELAYLNKLEAAKVLTNKNLKRLLATYKPFEIKSPFDYLAFCEKVEILDLKALPTDPKVYFPLIFNRLKRILPNFDYKNLTVQIITKQQPKDDLLEKTAVISFDVDGKTYKQTFWHDFKKESDAADSVAIVRDDFHKGINRWLADNNRAERLYCTSYNATHDNNLNYAGKYREDSEIGLILMTQQQHTAWLNDKFFHFFSRETHDNSFNTEGVKKLITTYENLGLFAHLSQNERDSAQLRATENVIGSYQDLLSCFPKTIVYFDWETGNLENPYEELTLEFGNASRGAFTPTAIVDSFDLDKYEEKIPFGFTFKGKTYQTQLKMNRDWLDYGFFELIEKALTEHKIDGKFYHCLSDGQAGGYIFLTQKQYDFLIKEQAQLLKKID